MDYSRYRNSSSTGKTVSVNHKALITRALTKYPVDFALFRELLQNSADAQSNTATIEFETSSQDSNLGQIHNLPITRLRFTNDGLDFTKEDWNRLKEIASGNPNETKIGAFGVGFYSVFELTEEPLVHSGNQIMNFEYKGIQLHYHFTEEAPKYQKGTLIDLPYRSEGKLPDLVKFVGFLVQSFLLINLNEVRVVLKYPDARSVELLSLSKSANKPIFLEIPRDFRTKSPHSLFKLANMQTSAIRVTLKYLNATQMPPLTLAKGFLSFGKQLVSSLVTTSGNPEEYTEVIFELTKVDAFVDVSVSTSYRNKMIETLLKPPPKQAVMSLLSYTSPLSTQISSQLQSYVFPKSNNDAKIFIGFPTKQSTGIKSHLGLNQVIPTMERTAIDMSNQFVKDWNGEMLYMSGVMARVAYENELELCRTRGSSIEDSDFIYSRFMFGPSAPDAVISLYIKEGFWSCSSKTLVPTTKGIVSNQQARMARDSISLLRVTPAVVNETLARELNGRGLVEPITYEEIANDVKSAPMHIEQCQSYIRWLAGKWPTLEPSSQSSLLMACRFSAEEKYYDLANVKRYHDRSKLPDDEATQNLPRSCLPSDIAIKLGTQNLSTLGIMPLHAEEWVKFRLRILKNSGDKEIKESHDAVARGALLVASKAWARLPNTVRKELQTYFLSLPCIPTQLGLKLPQESYVKRINIFPHLPVVAEDLEIPVSWLKIIGVRESISMDLVLDALNEKKLTWTNEDLINYVDEASGTLQPNDWKALQEGNFFSSIGEENKLYRLRDLYAPADDIKRMKLPVLAVENWSNTSRQANILFRLGLRRFPTVDMLFAKLDSESDHNLALKYFVSHYEEAHYSWRHISQLEILPTTVPGLYSKPSECYRDIELLVFDELVLSPKWESSATLFGVQKRPPMRKLLSRVLENPKRYLSEKSQCDRVFTYFGQNLDEFSDRDVQSCRETSFIPITSSEKTAMGSSNVIKWEKPSSVFLPYEVTDDSNDDIMRPLLNTIYPGKQSRPFLSFIGVTDRPSLMQIALMLVDKPARVFSLLKSTEDYEMLLSQIDLKWSTLAQNENLVSLMKTAPFLMGLKYKRNATNGEHFSEMSLYKASELAIVDDIVIFNQFKDKVITAPQDETLERLYKRLNVPKLSDLIQETVTIGMPIVDESKHTYLEQLIRERLRLFMENTSKKKLSGIKEIEVFLVNSLEVKRKVLPNTSVTFQTSAFMHPTIRNRLLIVPGRSFDWIDVATALVKSVLAKPDQDSVVVLEIQLSSDLDTLERKGYNIQRVRKNYKKEKTEKVIPKLGLDLSEDSRKGSTGLKTEQQQPVENFKPAPPPQQMSSENISNDIKHPAISQKEPYMNREQQQRQQQQYHPKDLSNLQPQSSTTQQLGLSSLANKFNLFRKSKSQTTTSQHSSKISIQSQLQEGIRRARPFQESQLISPQHVDVPAAMNNANCLEPQKIHNLKHLKTLENGIEIYGSAGGSLEPFQDELVLSEVLMLLCNVFQYPKSCICLYRDADTKSVAFNYNGSLFFNSLVTPTTGSLLDYYFPVMAHELAHNLVSSHGASHSFYTESYVQNSLQSYITYR